MFHIIIVSKLGTSFVGTSCGELKTNPIEESILSVTGATVFLLFLSRDKRINVC